MTLRPDLVQSAIVQFVLDQSTITVELGDTDEVREREWQGREFDYPNVRFYLGTITPTSKDCNKYDLEPRFIVFSEESSSAEANKIAGIINTVLHDKGFTYTVESTAIHVYLATTSIIPAIREDERTWRAELMMRGEASG